MRAWTYFRMITLAALVALPSLCRDLFPVVRAEETPQVTPETLAGTGPGWRALGPDDFTHVNCAPDTWSWKDGSLHCTGQPVGVIRSVKKFTNLEMVAEWRHLKPAGNSGIFLWALDQPLLSLKPGQLPHGIEVQVLDLGYKEQYEKSTGKKADWFTTHGDVFPVGAAKMTPIPPTAPSGSRAFPKKETTKGVNQWNHYYIRAVDGDVRLWVNGEQVTRGTQCDPRTGYLCLESEGSPIEFRNLRIRELP
ncbi:MAG: DUF1080 domain-containing protein [Pirellulales bacterium]